MRLTRTLGLVAVTAGVTLSCSDIGPTEVTIADLAGTWSASKWEYKDDATGTVTFNAVSFGFSATITLQSGGSFSGSITVPPAPTASVAGTASIASGVFTITWAQDYNLGLLTLEQAVPLAFDFTLDPSGNLLTLFDEDSEWDFTPTNGEDNTEPASLTVQFTRS
ncbi:MAG TPA: hypothetical protein VGA22_04090 [Gemmatimonadales bacterium]|jgi:hypothetical protein